MKKLLMTAVYACVCAALAEPVFWKDALPMTLDANKTFELRVAEAPKTGDVSLLVALSAPVDDTFRPTVTLNGVTALKETRAPLATWLPGFDATPIRSPQETREIQAGYRYSFPLSALKAGGNTVTLGPAVGTPKLHAFALDIDPTDAVVVENDDFRLIAGKDALVKSLVVKKTGEECVDAGMQLPLFTVTQDRPFHNEFKLIHPNKRTVYPATRLRRDGDILYAGFSHDLYEAQLALKTTPGYVTFTLIDFPVDRKPTYDYLRMDLPPVTSFRIQLPIKNRANFGDWLNASWDEKAAVCVTGTSPHPDIDHEARAGAKILYAEAMAGIKLRGAGAALLAAPGREAFLDAMDALEKDFGLPRGVKSRRSPDVQEAIFHVCAASLPADIDELIFYAKKGGFKLMTFAYGDMFKTAPSWGLCGDYDWKDSYPNREADLKAMLDKVKAAGIKAGFHTLHSHIGLQSRYVTPVADPRLNKTRRFTLAAPLSAATNDTEITVYEPTDDVVMYAPCRILQFGGELVSYESYTTEPPYKFLGVKRGAHKTHVVAHPQGEVGGILDISEFGSPMSCYADQNTDLQDEVAVKLARAYNCGFEYVYLDGSEGVNRPFNYHVANAQLKYWKLLKPEPSFGEGAAKTHFGWHMLAGANAFDTFRPEIFKAKLREFPFKQAPITQQDMSRVDFGWWLFYSPSGSARSTAGAQMGMWEYGAQFTAGTQMDMWEYGASVAAAWDCAISILMPTAALKRHPRADDILEMMRRWGDCRRRGLFKDEWRPRLKNYAQEHHLVLDAQGDYDLVDYFPLVVGNGQTPVRAFVFTKDNATWVVYWHGSGEGQLRLPIKAGAAALYDDFAGKAVAFKQDGASIVVPATKRLYLKTTLARDAVEQAFATAALLPPEV